MKQFLLACSLLLAATPALQWIVASRLSADDSEKTPAKPADEKSAKRAGTVRDDNGLAMPFAWCPAGSVTMENIVIVSRRTNDIPLRNNKSAPVALQLPSTAPHRGDIFVFRSNTIDKDAEATEHEVLAVNPSNRTMILKNVKTGKIVANTLKQPTDIPWEIVPVKVALNRGFWIGQHEVTQREWKQIMGTKPWTQHRTPQEGDDLPTTYVNWEEAQVFCRKLTDLERAAGRIPDGWEYTLPTEAQWEYACRAGTETLFPFGEDDSQAGDYGWFHDNAAAGARPVGTKKPNAWGISDMCGNVWEWCRDVYVRELPGGKAPDVNEGPSLRVYRGGCWYGPSSFSRSALRNGCSPTSRDETLGFRVSLNPAP